MAKRTPVEFPFPLKGRDDNWASRRQPKGTTPGCLNVRPFDSVGNRLRGGQRDGLSKYIAGAVNGTNHIQALGFVTRPADSAAMAGGGLLVYEDCEDTISNAAFQSLTRSSGVVYDNKTAFTYYTTTDGTFYPATRYTRAIMWKTAVSSTVGSVLSATIRTHKAGRGKGAVGFIIRAASAGSAGLNASDCGMVVLDSSTNKVSLYLPSTTYEDSYTFAADTEYTLTVHDTRSGFNVYVNGVSQSNCSASDSELGTNNYVGFIVYGYGTNSDGYIDDFTVSEGVFSQQPPERKIIAVSGGSVYQGDPDDSSLTVATNGASVVAANRPVRFVEAFTKAYFVDGTSTGYERFTSSNNAVDSWSTAVTGGALPTSGSYGATMIALYRGRIVVSGEYSTPNNWYMSAVGDPLDWDTGAVDSPTMAVSGTTADCGELGDIITCLMPYSDDLLVFGAANSLWLMRGDPAAGGILDALSYQIGISGPDAATWDAIGNLYFYGTGGIWRLAAGAGELVSLTDKRLKQTFADLDLTTYNVVVHWDQQADGLHVFLVPNAQPTTAPTHWFWDRQTDSWWEDQFPVTMGPSAAVFYPADVAADRALLLGGWDGVIRQYDSSVTDDDGTVIASHVDFTPLVGAGDLAKVKLTELVPILGSDSDPVTLKVYAGTSAEAVIDASTPQYVRVVSAGRNPTLHQRVSGNALKIRLQNESASARTWNMESLTGIVQVGGRARHGRL